MRGYLRPTCAFSSNVLFHILSIHLHVTAGHGKDDAEDGDVEQHGKEEPGFRIGPHLRSTITKYLWVCIAKRWLTVSLSPNMKMAAMREVMNKPPATNR